MDLYVYSVPMRMRFRGIDVREGVLIEGERKGVLVGGAA